MREPNLIAQSSFCREMNGVNFERQREWQRQKDVEATLLLCSRIRFIFMVAIKISRDQPLNCGLSTLVSSHIYWNTISRMTTMHAPKGNTALDTFCYLLIWPPCLGHRWQKKSLFSCFNNAYNSFSFIALLYWAMFEILQVKNILIVSSFDT